MAMTKSASAALFKRRLINLDGVRGSLKLITAKSLTSGAPKSEAAALIAVTPG